MTKNFRRSGVDEGRRIGRHWRRPAGPEAAEANPFRGHSVTWLAVEGKFISSSKSMDGKSEYQAVDATLTGHRDAFCGLLKHCECLISASVDGTIRLWSVGTWVKLRIVRHRGLEDWLRFLVARMSMLSSGSRGAPRE